MTYARETTVSIERSKAEIEQTLSRYGAAKFFSGWDEEHALIGFSMEDRFVQFRLPTPKRADFYRSRTGQERSTTQAQKAFEQAQRSSWRALLLVVKSKLESVESGIETFEQAFLAHIMVADGTGGSTTVGEVMLAQIEESYAGHRPQLALPAAK